MEVFYENIQINTTNLISKYLVFLIFMSPIAKYSRSLSNATSSNAILESITPRISPNQISPDQISPAKLAQTQISLNPN